MVYLIHKNKKAVFILCPMKVETFTPVEAFSKHFPELFSILENFFIEEKKVAVALSWGMDSMFVGRILASFWKEKKWNPDLISFLHCNHKVRKESDEEASFLKAFFKERTFKLFEREGSKDQREATLRNWRYGCFREFCKINSITTLIIGHHLGDRVETSLMNSIRGCGLRGFMNMQRESKHPLLDEISVLRPLLWIPKHTIEALCEQYKIPFFEDQSNFDTGTSLRNQIRIKHLEPLSKIRIDKGKEESQFWESWKAIYASIEHLHQQENPWLRPLALNPYWNVNLAFERSYPVVFKDFQEKLALLLYQLEITVQKTELEELTRRWKAKQEGFRQIGKWTFFQAQEKLYLFKTNKRFWEKELHLEKKITESGVQIFWNYKLDIPEELIGSLLKFPQSWDRYRNKSFTKWTINQHIPIFWRNILPLAEKDEKVIHIFRPEHLFF